MSRRPNSVVLTALPSLNSPSILILVLNLPPATTDRSLCSATPDSNRACDACFDVFVGDPDDAEHKTLRPRRFTRWERRSSREDTIIYPYPVPHQTLTNARDTVLRTHTTTGTTTRPHRTPSPPSQIPQHQR
ncbi:hypothetical protein PENSPDRAFT_679786 [Peniophora sp. CONT]|nr:hypothetical protein PENSPDRAFT_679786 [Peniophora sp. CONT]